MYKRYVTLVRSACMCGVSFVRNVFKKKSCGASLCKSEEKYQLDEDVRTAILSMHGIPNPNNRWATTPIIAPITAIKNENTILL